MSATKINHNEARNLSERIANKAFEHLIKPAEATLNASAKKAYDQLIAEIGGVRVAATLVEHNIMNLRGSTRIAIKGNADRAIEPTYRAPEGTEVFDLNSYNEPCITNSELYDEISVHRIALNKLQSKRDDLAHELLSQMEGRSAKKMLTAWPEAESIFQEYFGVTGGGEISTPLESLLARFIPMLPAPTAG